jgi:flagellar biosynthesis chaperone FliJ
MKKFEWSLQRVLEVRKIQEQKKTAELFSLTEQLAATRGELLIKMKILENIIESISNNNFVTQLSEQEFFLSNSVTTNEQIKKIKEKISLLEQQQKEKITEVLKIRRLREALEKMREDAKIKFIQKEEKLEQKVLDDAAGVFFVRNCRN